MSTADHYFHYRKGIEKEWERGGMGERRSDYDSCVYLLSGIRCNTGINYDSCVY